jgi:hypothetical protein
MIESVTSLARTDRPDDLDDLRERAAAMEETLAHRAAETARAHADVAAFRLRYRREVGTLHEELEELERAIAEAELGEISRRLQDEGADQSSSPAGSPPESAPRYTTDAVRRLFREVAKAIHPDLALDDHTRGRRHSLMVEANRAYALGDEARLRSILHAWENSPEAVPASDPEAARLRLLRRISQIEDQLAACDRELEDLRASPLGQLKAMVDEAAAREKDLIAENVRRLKRDIMRARNRLDAMRWNP